MNDHVSDLAAAAARVAEEARRKAGQAKEAEPWPEPEPLSDPLPPAPPFPIDIMGGWEDWCRQAAETVSAPGDYVAMTLLTLGGAAIANTRWGSPWPGWREPPVLFAGLVGLPSSGKSPAIDTVQEPLRKAQHELAKGFDDIRRRWETDKAQAEAKAAVWEQAVKAAAKNGKEPPLMPADAVAPPEPRMPRMFTTDATVEAAAELAANEPKGIALIRDELAGWIGNMDKYGGGAGGDRAVWLEAYGGRMMAVDRAKYGGKPLIVKHLSIAVLGGIQPDKLAAMIVQGADDGMAARLCYAWPELVPLTRPKRQHDPERLVAAFLALRKLEMATDPKSGDSFPATVPFADAGASELHAFRVRNREREQGTAGMFTGWLGKNPGRVVRIACILEHLWWAWEPYDRPPPSGISTAAVVAAIRLVEGYLTPHAERVFDEAGGNSSEAQAAKDAQALADWIAEQPHPPTLHELGQRITPRRLRKKAGREPGLALLMARGWLRQERHDGKLVLVLNPALAREG